MSIGSRAATRQLGRNDLPAVMELLRADPVERVFVASRVLATGMESMFLGCAIWGHFHGRELRSMLHAGANLVPVGADAEALAEYVELSGPARSSSSIVGPAASVLPLWEDLCRRWGRVWSVAREVRPSQPMLAIGGDTAVPADARVRPITLDDFEPYFDAAVRMYTEEVGVSPIGDADPGPYRSYVRRLIVSGRAFGIVEGGRVLFKADLGSVALGVAQVQGVWLDPTLRGRGLSAPAMAAVVDLARAEAPTISLYVNSFNAAARGTYRRVGFEQVGEFATILF